METGNPWPQQKRGRRLSEQYTSRPNKLMVHGARLVCRTRLHPCRPQSHDHPLSGARRSPATSSGADSRWEAWGDRSWGGPLPRGCQEIRLLGGRPRSVTQGGRPSRAFSKASHLLPVPRGPSLQGLRKEEPGPSHR